MKTILFSLMCLTLSTANAHADAKLVAEIGADSLGCIGGAAAGLSIAHAGLMLTHPRSEVVGFGSYAAGAVGGCVAGAMLSDALINSATAAPAEAELNQENSEE